MKRILIFIAFVSMIASACAEEEVIDAGSKVDVIAVLTGYVGRIPISTGQNITTFTPNPSNASGGGFLFSILTPADIAGRFFLVEDEIGPRVNDPTRLFKLGTRYRFKVDKAKLFDPIKNACLLDDNVREAPITKEESDMFVESLNRDMEFCKKRIAQAEERLEKTTSEKGRELFRKSIADSQKNLLHLEKLKKDAAELLRNAKDDFPNVMDLKWKALEDEGWKDVPPGTDIESEHPDNTPKTNGQQDGGADRRNTPIPSSDSKPAGRTP